MNRVFINCIIYLFLVPYLCSSFHHFHKLKRFDTQLRSIAQDLSPQPVIKFDDDPLKTNLKNTKENPLKRNDPVSKLIAVSSYASVFNDSSVLATVQVMNNLSKGGAIILNRDGKLEGVFTERDFVNKILDTELTATGTLVSQVMTPVGMIISATDDTTISECRQIMLTNKIRRLPILDAQKNPIGLVSMSQVIKALQSEDFQRESSSLFGNTLAQVQEQSKVRANQLALERGEVGSSQDILRSSFVLAGVTVGAGLLQHDWIRDHQIVSMCATFFLGYVGIVFETYFEFNKAAIALIMSTALWSIYATTVGSTGAGVAIPEAIAQLGEKISEVSEVVYFILGAMTIVEIVDAHQGFKVVTDRIKSKNKRSLMWIIGFITFFMSAILDNLTTTIVMVSLIKKLLDDPQDRKLFGALVVVAANAGGAWTPIGDVTTTMLWINGQISALPTMTWLFLPSLMSVITSLFVLQSSVDKDATIPDKPSENTKLAPRGQLVFGAGVAGLLSVPAFKAVTGLPPYLGMLSALGVLWTLTDAIHAGEGRESLMAPAALKKIDTSGVLFFLGILLSVGALDSAGILRSLAEFLDKTIPNQTLIASIIGFGSAIIDNVPLVAATMGMYPISTTPMDSSLWQLIAYCAGTGGSLLVIGSAAGVALMGLEKVDFLWYAKNISLSALVGYLAGIAVYIAETNVQHLF